MVRDTLKRTYCGIGFLGNGDYATEAEGKATKEYVVWARMIDRCYRKNRTHKNKSYHDCTVCDEWHNFQVFAKWYNDNYPISGGRYQIDKDIKVSGNRVYGPEFCTFVSGQENIEAACARSGSFISPSGEVVYAYNIAKFALENGLSNICLYNVLNGKSKSHKGWVKNEL
mgnify:CR=1 FL=1